MVDVWKYLIAATKKDILALPDIESKVSLDTITGLSDAERALIGFHLCRGKAKPRKVGHGQNSWNKDKLRIAELVEKVKHWRIYLSVPPDDGAPWPAGTLNPKATWFIDPPYQHTQNRAGNSDRYPYGNDIDYARLAEIIKDRQGLVIACEGEGADYLPFEFLTEATANSNNRGAKRLGEYVYVQDNFQQIKIGAQKNMNTDESFGAAAVAVSEEAEETSSNGGGNTYDVAKRDEITDLGFRTEHTKNGFLAYEILGDRRVPESGDGFGTIAELVTAVKAEVQKTGVSDAALQGGDEAPAMEGAIEFDDDIITEEIVGSEGMKAYRRGRPELTGAGLNAAEAIEDLKLAETEAGITHEDERAEPQPEEDELDAVENIIDADEIDPDEEPAEQFEELGEAAEELAEGDTVITVESTGQQRMPGMGRVVNQELTDAALKYHSIKMERVALSRKEAVAKDELAVMVKKHENLFEADPDNSDSKIYYAGDIIVRDQKKYDEKITTEVAS